MHMQEGWKWRMSETRVLLPFDSLCAARGSCGAAASSAPRRFFLALKTSQPATFTRVSDAHYKKRRRLRRCFICMLQGEREGGGRESVKDVYDFYVFSRLHGALVTSDASNVNSGEWAAGYGRRWWSARAAAISRGRYEHKSAGGGRPTLSRAAKNTINTIALISSKDFVISCGDE